MSIAAPVRAHPNASLAAGAGSPAIAIVWALGYLGVDVSAEAGARIATVVATVALAIGRRGLVGIVRLVLHGNEP